MEVCLKRKVKHLFGNRTTKPSPSKLRVPLLFIVDKSRTVLMSCLLIELASLCPSIPWLLLPSEALLALPPSLLTLSAAFSFQFSFVTHNSHFQQIFSIDKLR
jgi:hypothetical protein